MAAERRRRRTAAIGKPGGPSPSSTVRGHLLGVGRTGTKMVEPRPTAPPRGDGGGARRRSAPARGRGHVAVVLERAAQRGRPPTIERRIGRWAASGRDRRPATAARFLPRVAGPRWCRCAGRLISPATPVRAGARTNGAASMAVGAGRRRDRPAASRSSVAMRAKVQRRATTVRTPPRQHQPGRSHTRRRNLRVALFGAEGRPRSADAPARACGRRGRENSIAPPVVGHETIGAERREEADGAAAACWRSVRRFGRRLRRGHRELTPGSNKGRRSSSRPSRRDHGVTETPDRAALAKHARDGRLRTADAERVGKTWDDVAGAADLRCESSLTDT